MTIAVENWDEESPVDLSACVHQQVRKTIRTIAGGGKPIYNQCCTCGVSVGNAIGRSTLTDSEYDSLPAFDVSFREQKEKERRQQVDEKMARYLQAIQSGEIIHTDKYQEYLLSPEWKSKRAVVLERDKYLCQGCRSAKATQVHHLTYEHVFNELLFELVSVCGDCHRKCHPEKQ